MSDASVRAIDGRAVVTVGGSELLAPLVAAATSSRDLAAGSAASAAVDAGKAAQSAALSQTAALTAPNVYADEASGRAGVADGRTFWTDLGAAGLGLFRRTTANASTLVSKIITGAMLASASGSALIGHSLAAIGSITRPVQAVLRDQAFNPRDFGAIGDGQLHRLSERFATLAAAQAVYPFATALTQSIDWAGIQAAFNAASENTNVRGTVRLPLGYFVLSEPLQMPSFCTFEGVSRYGSVLFNQVSALNAPMIVNKDPAAFIFTEIRNLSILGGTHAVKLNVTREVSQVIFSGVYTALQSVDVIEATSLQTTKFQDCGFGPPGSGRAINVTGFPCNAIEFYNTRVSSGASGVIRLRGYDGVHWYGGSMEGNGRSLKATGSIDGFLMTVTSLNDGIGPISPGDAVVGAGVTPGTVVVAGGTGTGGLGTYNLSLHSVADSRQLIVGPATVDLEYAGGAAASFTMSGVYVEGTPRLFMRSIGTTGTDIDCSKFTWATNGEPFMFDTGADMIAIGTNHFDTDVVGPLNTMLYGHTPRMGGNVNTWTSAGQNSGRVVTRRRDIVDGATFDLMVFNRALAQPGSGNMHCISGTLRLVARGHSAGGQSRSIFRSYDVTIDSESNGGLSATIAQTSSQDNVTTETAVVRTKATPGITELKLEVSTANWFTGLPSTVFAIFDYGGVPTIPADRMRVAAA